MSRLLLLSCGVLALACGASPASAPPADDDGSSAQGGTPPAPTGGAPSYYGGASSVGYGGAGQQPGQGGANAGAGAPGAAGSSGGAGAPAAGGGPTLPVYDPNVHFEWEETDPDALPPCLAGRYVGSFSGFYNLLIPVAGDIDMTLSQSQNGEFLEVSDGSMSGVANLTIPFSAEVVGRVDCTTKRFEATLQNGVYDVLGATSSFEGPFEADYDTTTHSMVAGTWTVTEPNPANGGTGEWTAAWTP